MEKTLIKDILIKNSLLKEIDIHFADYICDLQLGESDLGQLWFLAAFLSFFANQGDSAFSLDSVSGKSLRDVFNLHDLKKLNDDNSIHDLEEIAEIAELEIPILNKNELAKHEHAIGRPGDLKPIIFDGELFYLNRFYHYEITVAEFIKDRVSAYEDVSDMKFEINELFPDSFIGDMLNWQKVAAILALRSNFSVISGGPGTGKTSTVGKILTLLLKKNPKLIMKMLAPTGKAADRLNESIRNFKQHFKESAPQEIMDAIPETAETIHRFLGINSHKLKYDKYSPAPIDLLVIDEASMVSLPLFAKAFEALPESCRVILLGDKDQLMAVENGNVLKDITDAENLNLFSKDFSDCVRNLSDAEIELNSTETPALIEDAAIQLEYSWRFKDSSGIGALAKAVNVATADTRLDEFVELFAKYDDINLRPISDESGIKRFVSSFCDKHLIEYKKALDLYDISQTLSSLSKFRILCAVNEGPFGVNQINQLIEANLFKNKSQNTFYHGRPILISANDYRLNLMNGDVGVVIEKDEGELKACFPGEDGTFREFNPASLGEHRTAFSISIHKSQGSEFDNVFIILPAEKNKILSKELIYTAITRAKKTCAVIAPSEIFHQAAIPRIHRQSGLKNKLVSGHCFTQKTP